MANFANPVQTILQNISDLRGEATVNTDASRIRAVSNAALDFSLRRRWKLYLRSNIVATGDGVNNAYSIGTTSFPCRPNGLSEVFVDGLGEPQRYAICDYNEYKVRFNRNNAEQIVYQYYDQAADTMKMYINPIPGSAKVITYSYYFQHPPVTTTTDLVYCQDPGTIAVLALADIYHSEDELQKEIQQRNQAEQEIAQFEGDDNTPAQNQLYAMGAIENSITRSGIGNY